MTAEAKTAFAALPVRAIGDARLSALQLRVLACIAFHDRMSAVRGKGQGSWASHQTLADRVGCHYTSLSSAITELAKLGYLDREQHPLNKRLRVYRVRYGEPADSLPNDKQSRTGILSRSANETGPIVCPASEKSQELQPDDPVEYISLSDGRYSAEAGNRYSAGAAHLTARQAVQADCADEASIGATLAQVERAMKGGFDAYPACYWQSWLEWLFRVEQDAEPGSHEYGRAQRLAEALDSLLHGIGKPHSPATREAPASPVAEAPKPCRTAKPAPADVADCKQMRTSIRKWLRRNRQHSAQSRLADIAEIHPNRLRAFMDNNRKLVTVDELARLEVAMAEYPSLPRSGWGGSCPSRLRPEPEPELPTIQ